VDLPDDRETILPRIARWVLEQKEDDVVVQAVGRVRPFTKSREIITFQVGNLPEVRYTLEFRSLAEARSYFGIPTRRRSAVETRAAVARQLKALGLSKARIAEDLGVSLSTVKRYLHDRGAHEPLSKINTVS
jgi:DNA-directed RNA polymerase specialized sigma24 family protein